MRSTTRPAITEMLGVALSTRNGLKLASGAPGADQHDQRQPICLRSFGHRRFNLQQATDARLFHTGQLQSFFDLRSVKAEYLMVEPSLGGAMITGWHPREHEVAERCTIGRLTTASRRADRLLNAASTPRVMRAYAPSDANKEICS